MSKPETVTGDELYRKGVALVTDKRKATTSFLSRELQIGYVLAAHLMEELVSNGIVSEPDTLGRREVLR